LEGFCGVEVVCTEGLFDLGDSCGDLLGGPGGSVGNVIEFAAEVEEGVLGNILILSSHYVAAQ